MLTVLIRVLQPCTEVWEHACIAVVRVPQVHQGLLARGGRLGETTLGCAGPPRGPPVAQICQEVLNTTFPLNMLPHHPLSAMRLNSVRLQRTLHD